MQRTPLAGALADVAKELGKVSAKIDATEEQIEDARKKLAQAVSSNWPTAQVEFLHSEVVALRDEKKQLRDEKKQLRDKEKLLLEQKHLLKRALAAPRGAPDSSADVLNQNVERLSF